MKDNSLHSAGLTLPARLVLAADQGLKVMRYHSELAGLAYRQAYRDGSNQGIQGPALSEYIARAAKALHSNPTVQANAAWVVMDESWSRWSAAESRLPVGQVRKLANLEETLLSASRWRSVSEIANFPFASFPEMLGAVAAERCYISVSSDGFRFTNLTSNRDKQAFGGILSWVPFFVALASVVAAIATKNAWMLIGIPAAILAFLVGAAPVSLVRPILLSVQRASSPPLRLLTGISLALVSPVGGVFLSLTLLACMLLTDHPAGVWTVASYILSVHAIRVFRARGTIALSSATKTSEAFFLFALSEGLCGLRDKTTGDLLWRPQKAK